MKDNKFSEIRSRNDVDSDIKSIDRDEDVFATTPGSGQTPRKKKKKAGDLFRSVAIRNVPISLHNRLGDMVYKRITEGELMTNNSTILLEALEEYVKRHNPPKMPEKIRDQLARSSRRRS